MSKKHGKREKDHGAGRSDATDSSGRHRQRARDMPPSSSLWAAALGETAESGAELIGARVPVFPGRAAAGIVTVEPGSACDLSRIDPDADGGLDKAAAKEALAAEKARIVALQERLYAERRQSLLVVLQAIDTGGKDGTIRATLEGVNPQGCRVTSFKVPSTEELDHDVLWRCHRATPGRGMIGVFNRSHYEDVLVVRVNNIVPKSVWKDRYDHINNFEKMLADSGTRILKFYLHINRDEQKERFEERLQRPDKNWKFSRGDLKVREQWDDYMEAYEEAIYRCNTEYAPWFVVPANRKWYRNYIIMKTIVETLEDMSLKYPAPEPDLDKIVIDG